MLFWTPLLEYIKIRPSPISKLSPDAWAMFTDYQYSPELHGSDSHNSHISFLKQPWLSWL